MEDAPADLVAAIEHGLKILNWHENLQEEELPPKWMWHLDWELERWFEEVDALRKQKYSGSDDRDEVPLVENDDPEARKMIKERFGR